MALLDCAECGKPVSTRAVSCPSCGAPVAGEVGQEAVVTPGLVNLAGRIAAVLGAWVIVPWIVRLIVFVAGVVLLIVMFGSSR